MTTKILLERKRLNKIARYWVNDGYRHMEDWLAMGLLIGIITVCLTLFSSCEPAHAEPDYSLLADSIRVAEGNPNYGILTHYKHTSYRQACINTCKHAWKDYLNQVDSVRPGALNGTKTGYLTFLANRYAPIGAKNDPMGLNRNWLANVSKLYKGGI
jgi:hypothetical protein